MNNTNNLQKKLNFKPDYTILIENCLNKMDLELFGDNVNKNWPYFDFEKRTVTLPDYFLKELNRRKVLQTFNKMSFTHRKKWILALEDAKKEETKQRHVNKAIEKLLTYK